jgi:hypothetical protein
MEPPIQAIKWSNTMSKNKKDDVTIAFDSAPSEPKLEGESIIQLDHDGNFIEAHSYGNFVERIEGGLRITRPDGATISMIDGEITIENLVPKSVGIRDLSEIESFAVRTEDQRRIYRVDFLGDGHVEVTYSQDGKVLEVTGRNVNQTLNKDNEIICSQVKSVSG